MLDGTYNPGQLQAVREILDDPDHGFDTAVFSGTIAEYQWTTDDNGTPDDLTDDIVTVFDTVLLRDGIDTLKHVERLQFADASWTLDAGLGRNFDPIGQLTVIDNNGGTLQVGDFLSVSSLDVTDDDNISPTNPTGTVAANRITYVWQVERVPGTGVFEDLILGPLGDLAFQSANGQSLRLPPDVAGLSLRVKGVYQDDHGVVEQVFSPPTVAVDAFTPPTPTTPVAQGPTPTESGPGVQLVRSDLNFILDSIKIAEAHTAGADLLSLLPNIRSALGLRTVTGDFNNLLQINNVDQSHFGAANTLFPRLLDPEFRNDNDGNSIVLGPPGSPAVTNTDYGAPGAVVDADPRTISNLIVDQTDNNPAAVAAALQNEGSGTVISPGLDGIFGTPDDVEVNFIPNIAPDAGLTAPFNAWFTFFGQFFDHGLDLVTKGGNDVIYIPLEPDDPLFVPGGSANFMVLTRATVFHGPGADGIVGTADDTIEHQNTTSPFVDQNQTYTSHPSHQVFLRAYEIGADGQPHTTGKLITNRDIGPDGIYGTDDDVEIGGMATWAVVKAQARDLLGIDLTDDNVFNVPLLATDEYGNFIRGPNGFPQVVFPGLDGLAGTADDVLVEGNPAAPINLDGAVGTGHQFLIDIAHSASPINDFGVPLTADLDTEINVGPQPAGTYDNELLDAHYIAGDGRVNENIGLTAVHSIFHSEHNRLADQTMGTVVLSNDLDFINEWLLTPIESLPVIPAGLNVGNVDALNAFVESLDLDWNGERLFQVAKFGTEMQYQHLVFEEFARTIQPNVDLFFAPTQVYDIDLDPAIVAEFAHTVYRFGHSMLTETVDRYDENFNLIDANGNQVSDDPQLGLIAAFLNPLAFAGSGTTAEEATSAIVRGLTRQVGNEIDEFVTEALRNNLLGLPLDLPAINIARGRDTGIPTLNARAALNSMPHGRRSPEAVHELGGLRAASASTRNR